MNKRNSIHPSHMDYLALIVGRAVICFGIGALWVWAMVAVA